LDYALIPLIISGLGSKHHNICSLYLYNMETTISTNQKTIVNDLANVIASFNPVKVAELLSDKGEFNITNEKGEKETIAGTLKSVKAIGWYIEEYGIAQISMNLTNISVTPVHIAFDEVCRKAEARGLRVTGSELVGLIPLKAMLEAGKYFLRKQQRSLGVSDDELIKIAVKSMGLSDIHEFKPEEKIIERFGVQPGDLYRTIETAKWLLHAIDELSPVVAKNKEVSSLCHELVERVSKGIKRELLPIVALEGVGRVQDV